MPTLIDILRMMGHDAGIDGSKMVCDGERITVNLTGYVEYNGTVIGHYSEGQYKLAPRIALASPLFV